MKYLAAAALALMAASPALAQQAPGTEAKPPAAQPAPPAAGATAQPGAPAHFMTKAGPDQWLVGNLWDKNVYNQQGQSIGSLNDILVDPDGKMQALVVGVGGFLGMGEKNVAVNYDFAMKNGSIKPDRITLNMSEQDLRSAPAFARTAVATKGKTESSR